MNEIDVPPVVQRLFENCDSLAFVASFALLIEAVINMKPRDAALLRSVPILVGLGVSGLAFMYSNNLIFILFAASGIVAVIARLSVRDYWSVKRRFLVNCLALTAYLLTAIILYFQSRYDY